jgi:hypothetical protein
MLEILALALFYLFMAFHLQLALGIPTDNNELFLIFIIALCVSFVNPFSMIVLCTIMMFLIPIIGIIRIFYQQQQQQQQKVSFR